ncbi:Uncharacterised protein [Salmonella enterica subsp. arizonae]|uniref:Uncharacterized protein n=1 Tax=Salmonella enterica subsp. arizonae TaxID=59203 RepID=A0A2X4TVJ5_SALER|nr:hypothetical protein N898_11385 [Salmonella enterica subsp. arizonae serovar 62:z36:- str. RKS2983]SQI26668.1 Uncharacterised protein [Salmonella enterica subsp. arizonae]SUG48962.1 Uncharacterised protein [Salmonella enterica subsp. arizonae]
MVFIMGLLDFFTHQSPFFIRDKCYDRHNSVRLVIGFDLAINQIAQLGLSSFPVFYYLERLFSKRILVKAKDGK